MNIQQLEYIIALDKHKNFSKAAEACYITQATLSTMVKKLEEELNIVIFDRKKSPILTTEIGQLIIEEAKKAVHHSNRMKEISSEMMGRIEGVLKIGIIPTIAGNLIHRVISHINAKYPNLKLIFQEITTPNIIEQLNKGSLDLGIVSTPLIENKFEEIFLYYEKLMVYGADERKQTHFISPKDLANQQVWLLEQGNCLSDQIINICSLQQKELNTNFDFKPNSFDSLINLVDSQKGLTLIPELYYLDLPPQKQERVIGFEAPFPVRAISVIYNRPYAKLRLIEALANEIKSIILPILQTQNIKDEELLIAKM